MRKIGILKFQVSAKIDKNLKMINNTQSVMINRYNQLNQVNDIHTIHPRNLCSKLANDRSNQNDKYNAFACFCACISGNS